MNINKKKTSNKYDLEVYDAEQWQCIEKHIEENFGKFKYVLSEKGPSYVTLDIALIEPTPERDHYTLVTMGMGAHKMNCPPELAEMKVDRAELVICLPPDWDLESTDEDWNWPFTWLRNIGRLPIELDTWVGWGHTVPTNGRVSENASFGCMLLLTPWTFGDDASVCRLPDGDEVNFYQLIPIYEGEMEYKLENGIEALLEIMDGDEIEVVDIRRESFCDEPDAEEDNGLSLYERTELFWEWFSENEEELSDIIEKRSEHGTDEIVSLVDEGVSLISEDIYYNLGGEHEFNFSVEDETGLFYLLPYLVSRIPDAYKEKWKFYPYMPGTGGESFGLRMYDADILADEVMVSLEGTPDGKKYMIAFFNETLAAMDEESRYSAFYVLMRTVVGELLPHLFISGTESRDQPSNDMFPLPELEARLKEIASKSGRSLDPTGSFVEYELEPEDPDEPRFDVAKGVTCYPELVSDYYEGNYSASHGLTKYGGVPFYIAFANIGGKDPDALLEECKKIAQGLEKKALGKKGSGKEIGTILGYAAGESFGYIDILLYGGEDIFKTIADAMKPFPHIFFIYEFAPCTEGMHLCRGKGADLLGEIKMLHEIGAHSLILHAIHGAAPQEEWDCELGGLYARALNNMGWYDEALEILMGYEDEMKDDMIWNYRIGYSLYYLDREEEAAVHLQRSLDLGFDDDDTRELLESCREIMERGGADEDD